MDRFVNANKARPATASIAGQKRANPEAWKTHVEILEDNGRGHYMVDCTHCAKGHVDKPGGSEWRCGRSRIVGHLLGNSGDVAKCKGISEEKRKELKGSLAPEAKRQVPLPNSGRAASASQARESIAKCFYYHGLPLHVVDSPVFQDMIKSAGQAGPHFKTPNRKQLSTTMLDEAYELVQKEVEPLVEAAKKTGLSICSDGWSDVNRNPLLNFLVNTPDGPVFRSATDSSGHTKDGPYLAALLCEHIEELGPHNVIAVLTDNARACKAAGAILEERYPHISWIGCTAHCLDLLLKDIFKLDWAKEAADSAADLIRFFRKHQAPTAMLREET